MLDSHLRGVIGVGERVDVAAQLVQAKKVVGEALRVLLIHRGLVCGEEGWSTGVGE